MSVRWLKPQTVLVVEDDANTREIYRLVLTGHGYRVVAVEDGLDALKHLQADPPDAVVLDLVLPRLSGYDVYEELQANPRTRRIPVVVVTATEPDNGERAAFPYFLRKPFVPEALVGVVDYAIGRRVGARAKTVTLPLGAFDAAGPYGLSLIARSVESSDNQSCRPNQRVPVAATVRSSRNKW